MSRIPSVQRNEGKGVGCCLTQRKLQHVKQKPRASAKKGKTRGPESEPWRKQQAGKVVSLCKLSNPHH